MFAEGFEEDEGHARRANEFMNGHEALLTQQLEEDQRRQQFGQSQQPFSLDISVSDSAPSAQPQGASMTYTPYDIPVDDYVVGAASGPVGNSNDAAFDDDSQLFAALSSSTGMSSYATASTSGPTFQTPVISSGAEARLPSNAARVTGQPIRSEGAGFFREQPSLARYTRPTVQTQPNDDDDDDDIVIESAKPATTTAATTQNRKGKAREDIDLTAADSDDDVIVEDSPVCIGQIETLALIMYSVSELQPPPPQLDKHGRPSQQAPPPLPPLPVHVYRDVRQGQTESLRLITPKKKDVFGVVEQRMANIVGPLLGDGYSGTGITKEPRQVWCEAYIIRRHERSPVMLQLQLLLFCRSSMVQPVADHLERNTVFLQNPATYSPSRHHGAPYKNPHNPADGTGALGERRRHQMMSSLYSSVGNAQRSVKASDVQRQQVEAVFKELKSGMDLEETEPSPVVTAKLYPHQKQALSFLLDREQLVQIPSPETSNSRSELIVFPWQARYDMYNRRIGWKSLVSDHQITGPNPPPQARGAILADDMGLGKTLVIISLVCTTMDDAASWARQPLERDPVDKRLEPTQKKKPAASVGTMPGTGDVRMQDFGNVYGLDQSRIAGSPYVSSSLSPVKMTQKKKDAKERREKKREEMVAARFAKLVCRSKATLIVCPLSTVQNWESQFEEHTAPNGIPHSYQMSAAPAHSAVDGEDNDNDIGLDDLQSPPTQYECSSSSARSKRKVSVYVYHGASRCSDALQLASHDVVVTTYSTLATEYSKQVKAEERREEEEELAFAAARNAEDGIEIVGTPGDDQGGQDAKAQAKTKKRARRLDTRGEAYVSPLQQVQWYRIVLDEAHIIKEHTTVQARAACELSASRRAVLSGTPLQNSLNDLFSLVRFLRIEPFIDRGVWTQYIGNPAKTGDALGVSRLQLLMRHYALRRTKDTKDKEGRPILSLPPNNQTLVELAFDDVERAFYTSHHQRYKHEFARLEASDSVMKNYVSILQELLRLRQICVHMALVRDSEDREGADVVETIRSKGLSKSRAIELLALMRDSGEGNCAECGFELLPNDAAAPEEALANEDGLVDGDSKPSKKKARKNTKTPASSTSVSAIESGAASPATGSKPTTDDENASGGAFKVPSDPSSILTRCLHLLCPLCVDRKMRPGFLQEGSKFKADEMVECSVCRTALNGPLETIAIRRSEVEQASEDAAEGVDTTKTRRVRSMEHSTKTRALLQDIFPFSQANPASVNYARSFDEQPPQPTIGFQPVRGEVVKSVVFSQWTTLLDRIGDELDEVKIKYRRLDGKMNRDQRSAAMNDFKSDPGVEILLVSLRAGGVGLNLTAGRRVYLMEPFWNPAVENQAVDRIHRLGQTMPVQTVRFVIEKSIEMNMLKIQKRKTELANMSLTQTLSKAEVAKRRMEDLKTLLD